MKLLNSILVILIILVNCYLLLFLIWTLVSSEGDTISGLMVSIAISSLIFLVIAFFTFKKKYRENIGVILLNSLGLIWSVIWVWLLLAVPVLD